MKLILLGAIRFYQRVFSFDTGYVGKIGKTLRLPFGFAQGEHSESSTCRFSPTCSEYMYQAVERYGILYGSWLGVRRILKCHPWHPGGWDPIPKGN